jgi:signal transduction histidine kinase
MNAAGVALLAQTVANRSLRQLVETPVTLILGALLLIGAVVVAVLINQYGFESFAVSSEALLPWVWAGFGLCWLTLAMWLWNAVNSARRLALALRERQLATQSMEHAVSTKHALLRMVDYELRSPLQIIVTSAESLAHDLALAQSRPQTPIAVRRIQHAAAALQFRLCDLLTLARSDAGAPNQAGQADKAHPSCDARQIFDACEWVQDVCDEFEEAAQAKGLTVDIRIPKAPQIVSADSIRLSQVLRNLLHNAIRHTASGEVVVSLHALGTAPNVGAGLQAQLLCTVSDTGPGLPADELARLVSSNSTHDPFQCGACDHARIGLLVIRDVLQQLGGTVEVTTRASQGTSIHVCVPVNLPT